MSLNTILATTPLTSTGYHLKATGTTIGNSIIWDNGTNVGIGNTNTSYTLDVSGTGRFSSNVNIDGEYLTIGGATNNAVINNIASFRFNLDCDNTGTGESFTVGHNQTIINDSNVLFRIQDNGNVGIGTSVPVSKLQVLMDALYNNTDLTGLSVSNATTILKRLDMGYDGTADIAYIQSLHKGTAYKNLAINAQGGNVGIGTSTPLEKFVVKCGTDVNFVLQNYGGLYMASVNDANTALGSLRISSTNFTITSGGNVNINGSGFSDVKFYVKGSDATSSNYAALFVNGSASNLFNIRNDGAVQVFGSLSKGSGSFRIDHPLESMTETHQLVHSFIEGPRVDLIYRGKLTLVNGKAQANIDEMATMTKGTFEALCREVQCFTTNESGWDLVKGKVIGNIIYIESQNVNSTDEISWMVIGERKDKHILDTDWTDDNGKVIVEPLKRIEPSKPTEPITN